jgi:uncharacterized protein YbcC (UPF0753/DUF2309 family)
LLALVYASPERIDAALANQPSFRRLVVGEWITLRAIDPESGRVLSRRPDGSWVAEGQEVRALISVD